MIINSAIESLYFVDDKPIWTSDQVFTWAFAFLFSI